MPSRPFEILLVEDSPGDVWLTREILLQGSTPKNITVVNDGEQAMDYLYRRGKYVEAKRPDLILLDLNLPRRNGLEVLEKVKSDEALRAITIVVLTTSEASDDINSAYELNANCYIVKPVSLDAFTSAIRGIEEFWMSLATLPTTLPPTLEADPEKESEPCSSENDGVGEASTTSQRHGRLRRRIRYSEGHAHTSVAGHRSTLRRTSAERSIHAGYSRHRHW